MEGVLPSPCLAHHAPSPCMVCSPGAPLPPLIAAPAPFLGHYLVLVELVYSSFLRRSAKCQGGQVGQPLSLFYLHT